MKGMTLGISERDFKLEQSVSDRHHKLIGCLQPEAKSKLNLAFQGFVRRWLKASGNAEPYRLAYEEVTQRFSGLSSKQSELLCFYVLATCSTAAGLHGRGEREQWSK